MNNIVLAMGGVVRVFVSGGVYQIRHPWTVQWVWLVSCTGPLEWPCGSGFRIRSSYLRYRYVSSLHPYQQDRVKVFSRILYFANSVKSNSDRCVITQMVSLGCGSCTHFLWKRWTHWNSLAQKWIADFMWALCDVSSLWHQASVTYCCFRAETSYVHILTFCVVFLS